MDGEKLLMNIKKYTRLNKLRLKTYENIIDFNGLSFKYLRWS
jgi:hypothetical protein